MENSLNDSSGKLIDILISQHQSDLETIKEQLETSKQELNTCNDVSNHLNLIDNWLSNDKTTFFNFLNNKKQNKFINHFLKATRNEVILQMTISILQLTRTTIETRTCPIQNKYLLLKNQQFI